MTRTKPSFAPSMRRVLVHGYDFDIVLVDEVFDLAVPSTQVVHFRSVGAQQTPMLCGWDGGTGSADTEAEVTCVECLAIVGWFDTARKRHPDPVEDT